MRAHLWTWQVCACMQCGCACEVCGHGYAQCRPCQSLKGVRTQTRNPGLSPLLQEGGLGVQKPPLFRCPLWPGLILIVATPLGFWPLLSHPPRTARETQESISSPLSLLCSNSAVVPTSPRVRPASFGAEAPSGLAPGPLQRHTGFPGFQAAPSA
jgi:hypothetical protein